MWSEEVTEPERPRKSKSPERYTSRTTNLPDTEGVGGREPNQLKVELTGKVSVTIYEGPMSMYLKRVQNIGDSGIFRLVKKHVHK